MEDYKDIKDMLKPRRDFAASQELRNRINTTLENHTRKSHSKKWIWGISASCVAAAVLILILLPSGVSAKEILAQTLNSLLKSEGVEMTVEVRTRPMENFRYINLKDGFVEHHISVVKSDSTLTWRVDKGDRTAAGNNNVSYNWISQYNIGWSSGEAGSEDMLGEMAILLTPEKILENELDNCVNNAESTYSVSKKDGDIILTVHSQPKGDFSNPYKLNASIEESENIRRYVIDSTTKHLKSASVSILNGNRETEVLRITKINYGKPKNNLMDLPGNVRFIEMSHTALQGILVPTATEAASAFLNALEAWNDSILGVSIDENMRLSVLEPGLKGAVLESIDKAFISGNEDTYFVPYELRLPDGTHKRHNLALQKTNKGGWIVVGGL